MAIRKKRVGEIYVDSGTCIVGDPCYLRNYENDTTRGAHPLDGTWGEFLTRLPEEISEGVGAANIGAAVASSTGHGDGVYPVYIEVDDKQPDLVRRLIIEFIK